MGSVETTHGIIRLHAEDKPFLFISSIVDRVGYFDTEVDPKEILNTKLFDFEEAQSHLSDTIEEIEEILFGLERLDRGA